jgi:hypothetical protein
MIKIIKQKILFQMSNMLHGTQIISLIGAILVILSFLCRKEKNMRYINSLACIFCIVYSLMTDPIQFSNFLLNSIVMITNLYHLFKLNKNQLQKHK